MAPGWPRRIQAGPRAAAQSWPSQGPSVISVHLSGVIVDTGTAKNATPSRFLRIGHDGLQRGWLRDGRAVFDHALNVHGERLHGHRAGFVERRAGGDDTRKIGKHDAEVAGVVLFKDGDKHHGVTSFRGAPYGCGFSSSSGSSTTGALRISSMKFSGSPRSRSCASVSSWVMIASSGRSGLR